MGGRTGVPALPSGWGCSHCMGGACMDRAGLRYTPLIHRIFEIFTSQGAPPVSMTPAANFATGSASVVDTSGKFAIDTGGQTMGTISDCWQLKVNLKEKIYLKANSTNQEDFFHLPPVSTTLVVHLALRISPQKIQDGPNGIIRGLGKTDPCRKPEV